MIGEDPVKYKSVDIYILQLTGCAKYTQKLANTYSVVFRAFHCRRYEYDGYAEKHHG